MANVISNRVMFGKLRWCRTLDCQGVIGEHGVVQVGSCQQLWKLSFLPVKLEWCAEETPAEGLVDRDDPGGSLSRSCFAI